MRRVYPITIILLFVLIMCTACATPQKELIIPFDLTDITASPSYKITIERLSQGGVTIHYPQLHGLADADKEQAINGLIKESILPLAFQTSDYFIMDMACQISRRSDTLLSILYQGAATSNNYNGNVIYSTTIDLETVKILNLPDFVNIDRNLVTTIRYAKEVTGGPRLYGADKSPLVDELRNGANSGIYEGLWRAGNGGYYEFCVAPNAIIISVPVSHAGGDYALVRIPGQYDADGRFHYTPIVLPVDLKN